MTHVWDTLLTETDRRVIEASGFGKSPKLGVRPCLLIIDVQNIYAGPDRPITEVIGELPFGCGDRAHRAVEHIQVVLQTARALAVPVFYSRQVQRRTLAFSTGITKTDKVDERNLEGSRGVQIVDAIAPTGNDIVIDKSYASLFYGTPVLSYLIKLGIDTLLICGGSTSGCVRATAVDAVMRNYTVAIVEDCVYDRIEASHTMNLFDLWLKYAALISSDEAAHYLQGLRAEMPSATAALSAQAS